MTTNDNNEGMQVIGIRMSSSEVQLIDKLAENDGRSRSGYLHRVLSEHLKETKA